MSAKVLINNVLPLIKNRGVYIDIGANVGLTTIPMLEYFDTIHCFEPNPNAIEMFHENILQYDTSHVVLHKEALSNTDGTAILFEPNGRSDFSTIDTTRRSKWNKRVNLKTYEVQINTLDSYNFLDVSLIKIDTEQHENAVIQGSLETIKKYSPVVLLENKRKEATDSVKLLMNMGYKMKRFKADNLLWRE